MSELPTTDLVSTPGPWRWEVNFASRCIHLVGGKPQYDMTVMDFVRWGMGQAQPRFVVDGLLHKAEEFARVAPQRSHHKEWFQLLSHPDANLIAAAPDLLAALETFVGQWNACGPNSDFGRYFGNVRVAAVAALAKAKGK